MRWLHAHGRPRSGRIRHRPDVAASPGGAPSYGHPISRRPRHCRSHCPGGKDQPSAPRRPRPKHLPRCAVHRCANKKARGQAPRGPYLVSDRRRCSPACVLSALGARSSDANAGCRQGAGASERQGAPATFGGSIFKPSRSSNLPSNRRLSGSFSDVTMLRTGMPRSLST